MYTVIIIDSDPAFAQKLSSLLPSGQYRILFAPTLAAGRAEAAENDACVVVAGPSVPLDDTLAQAQTFGSVPVVAVAASVDTDLMRRAMRAGVHDVISAEGQTWAEVASAVTDAALTGARITVAASAPEFTPARGRIISVMGTKGGVGKSVIAINLAAALAAQGKRVVLVDLDLQSGDVGIMLTLEPARTIRDAAAAADRLDAEMLEGFLVKHSSGARVLLAPANPEDAEIVSASRVARILEIARGIADIVIVDTPSTWDGTTSAAADASDRIFAVTMLDVPSVKDTTLMIARLRAMGHINGQVRVVLNRAYSRVLIDEKDVEKALGTAVFTRLPSDRSVPRSVNRGIPLVVDDPRSAVAKAVEQLARSISGGEL